MQHREAIYSKGDIQNRLFTVTEPDKTKTTYTYDANGNRLKETKTEYGSNGKVTGAKTVLSNNYDLRNQLVRSVTEDTVINNTYNAAGYRVEKAVTKDGETTKIHFLYDGGSVIMESDENGTVTAKNTYGGPLLFRTVFDATEETYFYLYNAHGDVVTLLSDGEVAATYYYDVFGNILEQTGDVDSSILYAGYQYDEETGLYYLNARMYDPVTARFLQADTYLGSLDDPLSLNRYTYCLNNPHRYIDPSGHFAVAALLSAVAVRVLIGLATGVVSAGMEAFSQKVLEKRSRIDYDLVLYEGITGGILGAVFANGAGVGKTMARQAGKKHFTKPCECARIGTSKIKREAE